MNNIITLSKLKELMASHAGVDIKEVSIFIDAFTKLVTESLAFGETLHIKGVGTFSKSDDPQRVVTFVPENELSEAINAPFSFFTVVELSPTITEEDLNRFGNNVVIPDTPVVPAPAPQPGQSVAPTSPESVTPTPPVQPVVADPVVETMPARPEVSPEPPVPAVEAVPVSVVNDTPVNDAIDTPTPLTPTSDAAVATSVDTTNVSPAVDNDVTTAFDTPHRVSGNTDIYGESVVAPPVRVHQTFDRDSYVASTTPSHSTTDSDANRRQTKDNDYVSESYKETYRGEKPPKPNMFILIAVAVLSLLLGFIIGYLSYSPINSLGDDIDTIDYTGINMVTQDDVENNAIDATVPSQETQSQAEPVVQETEKKPEAPTAVVAVPPVKPVPNSPVYEHGVSDAQVATLTEAPATPTQDANGKYNVPLEANDVYETTQPGRYLENMANEYYGSGAYWVYIYLENKNVIKDPNNIPPGVKLHIPRYSAYKTSDDPDDNKAQARQKAVEIKTSLNLK